MPMDLREQKFGIEIELTGLTRKKGGRGNWKVSGAGNPITMAAIMRNTVSGTDRGRKWKVMYDSSIVAVKKGGGSAGDEYKVEFVSPSVVCRYPNDSGTGTAVKTRRSHSRGKCRYPCSCECSTLYGKNTPQHYKHHVLQGRI